MSPRMVGDGDDGLRERMGMGRQFAGRSGMGMNISGDGWGWGQISAGTVGDGDKYPSPCSSLLLESQ